MKAMYILHSCIAGGATISFLNLVEGIRKEKIEVVVVHPKPNEKDKHLIKKLTDIGCKCITTRVASSYNTLRKGLFNYIKFLLRFLLIIYRKIIFYKELNLIVKTENPDIIHTNTGVIHEGYFIAKKYNIPHVWHLREYQTKDFNWIILPSKELFVKILKKSYSICITKDIQKYFNLENEKKSLVIYNPSMSISLAKIQYARENYFLVANRMSREKGIIDILRAFSIFINEKKNYKLLLLGFGAEAYMNELKETCRNLNIESSVEFLGYREDVYSYMGKAKALIVASFSEGFGRMTAEANMLGVPVIGRNTAGTKEILELTKGGFLFKTVEQMAGYMKEIASKTDKEIQEFMEQPRKLAVELFSNEQHIKRVLNLYKTLLKKM